MTNLNRLEATRGIGKLVDAYYDELRQARAQGRKVVWTGGTAPFIHLTAQDCPYFHAESFGAYTAGRKEQGQFLESCEAAGYSAEICSYERVGLGLISKMQHGDPLDPRYRLPPPDFAYASRCCPNHAYFVDAVSRKFNVPRVLVDVPLVRDDSEFAGAVDYVERQYNEIFIPFMERMTGRPYNWDELERQTAVLKRVLELRSYCMELCKKNKPAPMTFFDASMSIAVVLSLGGRPETIDYYENLKAEVEQRVSQKVGALKEEKYRLYWDHIPIWYKLRELSERFADYGANIVAATYTHGLAFPRDAEQWDPEHPIRSLSEFLVRSNQYFFPKHKMNNVVNICRDYQVDGVVLHNHRTCRYMDFDQYETVQEIERKLGIPCVIIDGDAADPQFLLPDVQLYAKLDTFMEIVDTRKRARLGY